MGQKFCRLAVPFGPVPESTLGEPFLTEPETKLVVDQDFDGLACPAAEDEHPAGEGVASKALTAKLGQAVDSIAEVHWFHCDQYAHLRSNLNQRPPPTKAETIPAASKSMPGFRLISIRVPSGREMSITRPESGAGSGLAPGTGCSARRIPDVDVGTSTKVIGGSRLGFPASSATLFLRPP